MDSVYGTCRRRRGMFGDGEAGNEAHLSNIPRSAVFDTQRNISILPGSPDFRT